MKKIISLLICLTMLVSASAFDILASGDTLPEPQVLNFELTSDGGFTEAGQNNTRASDLILGYALSLEKTGTTLKIYGQTYCDLDAVKCGFKNLVIQYRASSSDSWKEYHDYGNVYIEARAANLSTTLTAARGYQYRISCKHYAQRNFLSVQTIANTSNIVTVS